LLSSQLPLPSLLRLARARVRTGLSVGHDSPGGGLLLVDLMGRFGHRQVLRGFGKHFVIMLCWLHGVKFLSLVTAFAATHGEPELCHMSLSSASNRAALLRSSRIPHTPGKRRLSGVGKYARDATASCGSYPVDPRSPVILRLLQPRPPHNEAQPTTVRGIRVGGWSASRSIVKDVNAAL
jgi:hypothetical protein